MTLHVMTSYVRITIMGKRETIHTLQQAVRSLRESMELTQEGLARHMNLTVRSIARYEGEAPPSGRALSRFRTLAFQHNRKDLAVIFHRQLMLETNLQPFMKDQAANDILYAVIWGLEQEFESGSHVFRKRLLECLKPTFAEIRQALPETQPNNKGKRNKSEGAAHE